jgi:phosphohistidine swiveling domain-containing protein
MSDDFLISLINLRDHHRPRVGGKAAALARLAGLGFNIAPGLVITTDAYGQYIKNSGLREKIAFEMGRKDFNDMRWEEIWDLALRIRSHFLKTPLPEPLKSEIGLAVSDMFVAGPVVVRSTAPDEDAAASSFAGLHESYVNVAGTEEILNRVRLVWASLWSDRALLYRRELNLDIAFSAMAVVIQRLIFSRSSGVLFTQSPNDAGQMVIEAVYGQNQGLVDGAVEPDRWFINKSTGEIISHQPPAARISMVRPVSGGAALGDIDPALAAIAPLTSSEIAQLWELGLRLESVFGGPQDIEWTIADETLYVMQARPITTGQTGDKDDQRSWYMSLHRSFDNLKALRGRIEQVHIPAMQDEAARLAETDIDPLSDRELADALPERQQVFDKWNRVYHDEFIPFAHGMRLFGQVYNDLLTPGNPYEFMDLLKGADLESLRRNRMLAQLANMLRENPAIAVALEAGQMPPADSKFSKFFHEFARSYEILFSLAGDGKEGRPELFRLLLNMSRQAITSKTENGSANRKSPQELEAAYIEKFPADRQAFAAELLDIGRASYRLRDDDNIHLGRIEAQLMRAVKAARQRIAEKFGINPAALETADLSLGLTDPDYIPPENKSASAEPGPERPRHVRTRQLSGQPASPGIAVGPARVIKTSKDLFGVQAGDVLVCDAVDPNITFVIPMTVAIVERRGGMLIHGAIIAREYGIPCVTGIPDAIDRIPSGAVVTVDGYLGLVTVTT